MLKEQGTHRTEVSVLLLKRTKYRGQCLFSKSRRYIVLMSAFCAEIGDNPCFVQCVVLREQATVRAEIRVLCENHDMFCAEG